jgi:antitoxin PrlF
MLTATLTSQGRVTIPIQVRTAMGLHAGTKVEFVASQEGFKLVVLCREVPTLRGRFVGRVKKPISMVGMDAAIAAGVIERLS